MPKYKKYIAFQSHDYYPAGGLADITGSFDTIEECREHIKSNILDENEIVDRDTWEVVEEWEPFSQKESIEKFGVVLPEHERIQKRQ